MFFSGSRYMNTGAYIITTLSGAQITVAKQPLPLTNPILGYHPRQDGQTLDMIANNYLSDPTTFWRLCDANDAVAPDALAAHNLIGVPSPESS